MSSATFRNGDSKPVPALAGFGKRNGAVKARPKQRAQSDTAGHTTSIAFDTASIVHAASARHEARMIFAVRIKVKAVLSGR